MVRMYKIDKEHYVDLDSISKLYISYRVRDGKEIYMVNMKLRGAEHDKYATLKDGFNTKEECEIWLEKFIKEFYKFFE